MKWILLLVFMVLFMSGAQAQELDIDVSEIPMIAKIDSVLDLSFYVVDGDGNRIDPDTMSITVRHPHGIKQHTINYNEIKRVGVGSFEITHEFDTLEKYSFDITAEKEGYDSDFCKATVSINSMGVTDPNIFVVAIVNIKYVLWACGFLCVGIVVLDRKHKPRGNKKDKNGDEK